MLFVRSAISATGGVAAVSSGTVDGTNWAQGYVLGQPLVSNAAITAADEFNAGFAYTNGRALRVRDCTVGGVPANSTRGYNGIAVDSTGRACYSTVSNPWSGSNYLWLPFAVANYASTPDSAAVSITGDMELQWFGAADDWSSADVQQLASKRNLDSAWNFYLGTTGRVFFDWWNAADANFSKGGGATQTVPVADKVNIGLKVTIDVDDGAGNNVVSFFYSTDSGATWTALGTPITTAGTTNIKDTADAVEIGTQFAGTLQPFGGKVTRFRMLNGINGTVAFDANFATVREGATTFAESSANAATVTINGTQSYVYSPVMVGGMAVAGDGRFFMTVV